MKQLTEQQAIVFAKSKEYEHWTDEQIVRFQLFQKRLCMDFGRFHQAMEAVLGRPVWTHEFADADRLKEEYLGTRSAPTMEEIINLIPEEKRLILNV